MREKVLVIKLGALGDVIRTTPLLRVLDADVSWITSAMAFPLLGGNPFITDLAAIDSPVFSVEGKAYDLVINLEDGSDALQLTSSVVAGRVVGPYLDGGQVMYATSAPEWFDMSLSSRFGRERADELKMQNRRSYQDMMFSAVGFRFRGEDPVLNLGLQKTTTPGLVGIEERAGGVWPNKRWPHYRELAKRLETAGYATRLFRQRESVVDYADDINECDFVVCGDTLAMHIALALQKRVVALFTCTSPHEIYGYGRLEKVVSPLLERFFYRRDYSPQAAEAITIGDVEAAFLRLAQNCP